MERVGGGVPTVNIRSRKVQISSFLWTELQQHERCVCVCVCVCNCVAWHYTTLHMLCPGNWLETLSVSILLLSEIIRWRCYSAAAAAVWRSHNGVLMVLTTNSRDWTRTRLGATELQKQCWLHQAVAAPLRLTWLPHLIAPPSVRWCHYCHSHTVHRQW